MSLIACSRCGRLNSKYVVGCPQCDGGIELAENSDELCESNPAGLESEFDPGATAKLIGASSPRYDQPNPDRPEKNFSSPRESNKSKQIASRLLGETKLAIFWVYFVAFAYTAIALVSLIVFLMQAGDFSNKWNFTLGVILSVVCTWVAIMFITPFYSYMNLRAQQTLDRNNG